MEMRDPSAASANAAEKTLSEAPVNDAAEKSLDPETTQSPVADTVAESSAPSEEESAGTQVTDAPLADLEAEVSEAVEEAEQQSAEEVAALDKDGILAAARELEAKDIAEISGDDLRRLRQHYNAIHKNETDEARTAWAEAGNDAESFVEPADDEKDTEIKKILNDLRERKAVLAAEQEAKRQANLERKNAIIAEIIALAEDTDNVNRTFPRYRELQDEFNACGDVPATEETNLWKRFQDARERYSDNLKINKELRDYDFKKNLDSKMLLLSEAEGLTAEEDVIVAYRRLQELHNKWRQVGPVAKEIREEIWEKFKNFSAEINKRYQAYFEARKAREAENEAGKTALCERVEAVDLEKLKTFAAWDEATKEVIAAQTEWKTLGFASRKLNNRLFARFRAACDKFFAAKSEFFKSTRDELSRNLAAKVALCERAEALKDSTDWRKAGDEFVAMQKEWKTIGTVAKKHSDAIWQRFLAACDHFFEQKKKATSGVRQTENANLKAKRDVIARLGEITAETPREEAIERLKALQAEWKSIGHVPFREKDKVYEAFRDKLNELRDALELREHRERMNRFETAVAEIEGDDNKLYREREKLLRVAEAKRNELRTYENNLGFLSAKSKSGDSMLRDFQRKIERLKADIDQIDEKVKLIDSKL